MSIFLWQTPLAYKRPKSFISKEVKNVTSFLRHMLKRIEFYFVVPCISRCYHSFFCVWGNDHNIFSVVDEKQFLVQKISKNLVANFVLIYAIFDYVKYNTTPSFIFQIRLCVTKDTKCVSVPLPHRRDKCPKV